MADALNGAEARQRVPAPRAQARHARRRARIPMAIADYVAEAFETDAVRGAIACPGRPVHGDGSLVGRHDGRPARRLGRQRRRGGRPVDDRAGRPRRARRGARRRRPRVRRRDPDRGRGRAGARPRNHRAYGVALADGPEIRARVVVTAADPKRTLTTLVDPVEIGPHLRWRATNIRTPGTVSKVNLALSGLPAFDGADRRSAWPGRIVIAPSIDDLEQAFDASKYGRDRRRALPRGDDPDDLRPHARAGGDARDERGRPVDAVSRCARRDWAAERDRLGDLVVRRWSGTRPASRTWCTARQVITPVDLETRLRPVRAATSTTPSPGSISSSSGGRCSATRRYRFGLPGCTCAARARIPAAA